MVPFVKPILCFHLIKNYILTPNISKGSVVHTSQQNFDYLKPPKRKSKQKMQQRKPASGRPSGTDGSDFSYRMVVDSRYQKVALGKSRLYSLIFTQAAIQLIGAVYTVLSTSKEDPDRLAILAIAVGFVSLIIGELGRRRSRVGFLKIYIVASTAPIILWIARFAKSNFTLEVIQDTSNWETKKLELLEIACVLFGLLIQIFTIGTTISLIGNMSPPKRAS